MATPRITAAEQVDLRNKARRELERMNTLFNDNETVQLLDAFKNRFNACETVYKVILSDYLRRKGENANRLKINMHQVPAALGFAGYGFDRELLQELFGSEEKVGSRSVKKLRDATTHGVKQCAINRSIRKISLI